MPLFYIWSPAPVKVFAHPWVDWIDFNNFNALEMCTKHWENTSVGSGLSISRYSICNDSGRIGRTTKPDRDIPSFECFMANLNCLIVRVLKNVNYIITWQSIESCKYRTSYFSCIQYTYIKQYLLYIRSQLWDWF